MKHCTTTDEHRDEVDADREDAILHQDARDKFAGWLAKQDRDRLEAMWFVLGEGVITRYLSKLEMYDIASAAMAKEGLL